MRESRSSGSVEGAVSDHGPYSDLHAAQRGQNMVLFADAFLGPFHRNSVVAGIGFDPVPVIVGALAENFLVHRRNAQNLAEEVHHLLRRNFPLSNKVSV